MHRFFSPSQNIAQDTIIITDKEQLHHLKCVLRLKLKDEIIIFDEQGNEYSSSIEKLSVQGVAFKIKNRHKFNPPKNKAKITIACALPKKSQMDEIIDKLTQLGVDRIIPLETKRVIVNLDSKKKEFRLTRWRKIAFNASLQSQRNQIPIIESIKDIRQLLSCTQDFDLKLIPTLIDKRKSLKEILDKFKPKNILVLIGPEGDFTPAEVALAKRVGCIPVSLGNLVLRVNTAAIAVAAFMILYADR